jgi:hypothetical protein
MVASPLLILPRLVVQQGVFRHTVCRRLLPEARNADDNAVVAFELCETTLPALFCTCGVYALFEDDALPDSDPPPPAPETPSCPPGPTA